MRKLLMEQGRFAEAEQALREFQEMMENLRMAEGQRGQLRPAQAHVVLHRPRHALRCALDNECRWFAAVQPRDHQHQFCVHPQGYHGLGAGEAVTT